MADAIEELIEQLQQDELTEEQLLLVVRNVKPCVNSLMLDDTIEQSQKAELIARLQVLIQQRQKPTEEALELVSDALSKFKGNQKKLKAYNK
ncbi:MAG: hypothetical protein ACQEQ2_04235 [Pseudomonadota bacterium]